MIIRKSWYLLILFSVFVTLAFAKGRPNPAAAKKARAANLRKLQKIIATPILATPDVTKCIKGRTYLVAHIFYMCFHYDGGTIKTLVPMGKLVKQGKRKSSSPATKFLLIQ